MMIGDGANDAAALAAADVGIAVRGGAEVSLQAAPVYVGSGKLASISGIGLRRSIDSAVDSHHFRGFTRLQLDCGSVGNDGQHQSIDRSRSHAHQLGKCAGDHARLAFVPWKQCMSVLFIAITDRAAAWLLRHGRLRVLSTERAIR